MEIRINCQVKNQDKKPISLEISQYDIEDLIVRKAKEIGIKPYSGRVLYHYDEEVVSVTVVG